MKMVCMCGCINEGDGVEIYKKGKKERKKWLLRDEGGPVSGGGVEGGREGSLLEIERDRQIRVIFFF